LEGDFIKVIILCAGFATRLYPLTLDRPKSLLQIAGKPIIGHILEKLEESGKITEIIIVSNQKFLKDFQDWKVKSQHKRLIKILNDGTSTEGEKLGAVGDINFAVRKENLQEDIMVLAGDNLFDFDLNKIMDFFYEKKASIIALYDVKDKELIKGRYGAVTLDAESRVVNIEEKPDNPRTTLASTACYIFSKKDISLLEKCINEGKMLDNLGDFVKLLAKNGTLYGLICKGRWFDIGDEGQLKKADDMWRQ
jgi:glucose-1-phosphate thymidylyltransferase